MRLQVQRHGEKNIAWKRDFNVLFIGDVHGSFKTYEYLLFKMQHKGGGKGVACSLQVGDMGLGFIRRGNDGYEKDGKTYAPELGPEHRFIRGNHDDPAICRSHPNYAGDWKFFKPPNLFVVGGGFSIDYYWRTPGISWWENEELTNRQKGQMLRFYKQYKPRIVATHECPTVVKKDIVTNPDKLKKISRTEAMLEEMYECHKPEFWIFGHHHQKKEMDVGGVHFVGLDELLHSSKLNDCIYDIPELKWD